MSGGLTVQISEPRRGIIAASFEISSSKTIEESKKDVEFLKNKWLEISREEAPISSGDFRNSIQVVPTEEDNQIGFEAYSASPLNRFIKYGAKPHIIESRNPESIKGILKFQWENGPKGPGIYIFKKVNHPGMPQNDYFSRSIDRLNIEIENIKENTVKRFSSSFTGEMSSL